MATKKDNIKKLQELGVTKTEAELNALSAPEVATLLKEVKGGAGSQSAPKQEKRSVPVSHQGFSHASDEELEASDSVDVLRKSEGGGRPLYIRTYTKATHGEGFIGMAKQYSAKYSKDTLDENAPINPAREHVVVTSVSVPEVIVSYREKEDAELPLERRNPDAPFVDREKKFSDKEEALRFNLGKKGTIRVAK